MFFRRKQPPKRVLELNHEELVLLRSVMMYIRNKLIAEGKPIEDINDIILKLY